MKRPVKRAAGVASSAAAFAALFTVERHEQYNEVEKFAFAGVPLFWRDELGRPKLLGLPLRRWRGPRGK